mgnify:CR=1 FL=1
MIRAARAAFVLAAALAAFAPPASTAPLPSTQGDIDSLPPALQGLISATLGERDPAYRVVAEDNGLRARNARQALAASLGAGGMAISAGGGEWRMRLAGWQRGAGRQPAAAVATRVNRNRVEVERGGVTEWWVNGPAGLQQGWTVAARPFPEERGALTLVMAQSGSLLAKAAGDRSLDITDGAGRGVLRYGGLTAFDATGRELPASFEVAAGEVRVRVDDAAAVYPVLIDPIAQHAYLKASNTGMGDGFGLSVAIAGDTATLEGIELEAFYDAGQWFAGVAAHRIRGKNDDTGEGLYNVPADQVTLTVGVRALQEKLVAGARTRFVAKQDRFEEGDNAAFKHADAYTVVDLFAQYEATENTTINLNIDNVFDETYRQHLDQYNSPGFGARIGLTMRFGAE